MLEWLHAHGITVVCVLNIIAASSIIYGVLARNYWANEESHEYWERAIKKKCIQIDKLCQKKGYKLRPADAALVVWAAGHSTVKEYTRKQLEPYYMQLNDVLQQIEKH
jgi:hypothetical protein